MSIQYTKDFTGGSNATHTGETTGATALTISDNVIDEANLKLDDTPINGEVLTADSTTSGGIKWANANSVPITNLITVAKSGGDYTTIQAAIDYAVITYPSRSFNNPVVITVNSGEYTEQIHSYAHIIIQSAVAAYDPIQGQAKATIINIGNDPTNYPLRTNAGDVYYLVGMSIITSTANGVAGRIPEGTFKNCSFWKCNFIENAEDSVSQFQDCKWGNNTYGGFNLTGSASAGTGNILLNGCKLTGIPTFTSDTHTIPADTIVSIQNTEIIGSIVVGGDWSIASDNLSTYGIATRNSFDTTGEVKINDGKMVNGMHFAQAPSETLITNMTFENIEENQIPSGETDITSAVAITGKIQGNTMHNGLPSQIHMDNPDKFVGTSQLDGYISLKASLDSITDSSITKRYTIQVSAGIYTEDNPLQGKPYVSVKSLGGCQTTRIVAKNPTENLFIGADFFSLADFSLAGVNGGTADKRAAIYMAIDGRLTIRQCAIFDCQYGLHSNHEDSHIKIFEMPLITTGVNVIEKAIFVEQGHVTVNTIYPIRDSSVTTIIDVTGDASLATSKVHVGVTNLHTDSINITKAIYVDNGSYLTLKGSHIDHAGIGVHIQGDDTFVQISNTELNDLTGDAFYIPNVGVRVKMSLFGVNTTNIGGYDINALNTSLISYGQGKMSINNILVHPDASFYASIIDLTEDDEGSNILGKLHVGTPINPTESVFGGGDSYTRGMLVYSSTPAGVFTDRSALAKSASGSSFTFDGIAAGNAIYIASSLTNGSDVLKHYGIKTKVLTAAIEGTGKIVIEYWNGTTWVEFNGMEVESSDRYYPHAKEYFQHLGGNHIRYDSTLAINNWTAGDAITPLLGTDYYWIRFRIESDITTAPIFEQFKLHTNRTEINADGWVEYFGTARPGGIIPWDYNTFQAFTASPGNQDLFILNSPVDAREDIGVGRIENSFSAGALDMIGLVTFAPLDMDTSSPLKIRISFMSTGSGDVEWFVNAGIVKDGDPIRTNNTDVVLTREIHTSKIVNVPLAYTRISTAITLDLSEVIARKSIGGADEIWISISRDGGQGNDTLTGIANIIQISPAYVKWCAGGHI